MLLAILIGLILGLIGGGGSILAVPVLVYVLGVNPIQATAYSLFIVGFTALVGAQKQYRIGNIDIKLALFFGIPSFIGVLLSRMWIVPSLPNQILNIKGIILDKDTLVMLFFALVMLATAIAMLFKKRRKKIKIIEYKFFKIILDGLLVGIITGFVGAGGGFLIVPALVLLSGLSMKKAIGTSLMIIFFKSSFGFLSEIGSDIDWNLLLPFTILSVAGVFIGTYIGRFIEGRKLKKSFGIFILIMSVLILVKEITFL